MEAPITYFILIVLANNEWTGHHLPPEVRYVAQCKAIAQELLQQPAIVSKAICLEKQSKQA